MSEATMLTLMAVGFAIVIALGAILVFYSFRSYRRTGARPMALLGAGFVFLSMGTAASWFGIYFTIQDWWSASLGCVAMLAAGFALIVFGLRTRFG